MNFRLTKDPKLQALLDDLPRRVKNVGTEVGRVLAEKTGEEVRRRLAGRSGWVKIYHDAIIYRENDDGNQWAVAGYTTAHPELFAYPADTSLLVVDPGNLPEGENPSLVLAQYQPLPIDVIPALTQAYPGTASIRMYDAGTVETYRQAALRNLSAIREGIQNTGYQIDENGTPTWTKVYADLVFMARRLELGYSGYPRVPHWAPALTALQTKAPAWSSSSAVLKLVEKALNGGDPVEVTKMSASEASEFARIRAATWS